MTIANKILVGNYFTEVDHKEVRAKWTKINSNWIFILLQCMYFLHRQPCSEPHKVTLRRSACAGMDEKCLAEKVHGSCDKADWWDCDSSDDRANLGGDSSTMRDRSRDSLTERKEGNTWPRGWQDFSTKWPSIEVLSAGQGTLWTSHDHTSKKDTQNMSIWTNVEVD